MDAVSSVSGNRKRSKGRNFTTQRQLHNAQSSNVPRPVTKVIMAPLPNDTGNLTVTYTNDPVEVDAWLMNNVFNLNISALGFDIEWKPQLVKKKLGGVPNKTAVLQLSNETSSLVLHIFHIPTLTSRLIDVLANPNITKVGCGIRQDFAKVFKDTGMKCEGGKDLATLATQGGYKMRRLGLKSLCENVLGFEMHKPKRVQCSNWEVFPLKVKQIEYAALDAWFGAKLYATMKAKLDNDKKIEASPTT